jgi:Cellulase (glycosyl hydrolase family 5)/Bacterial Ig domain
MQSWVRSSLAGTASGLLATVSVGAVLTSLAAAAAMPALGGSYPAGTIDTPPESASLSGSATVTGWALDAGASSGTGVDRVAVYLDGAQLGNAEYGLSRPDVGAAYGARFTPSGFRFAMDLSGVAPGSRTLELRAHSTVSGADTAYRRTVNVVAPASTPAPVPTLASTPPPIPAAPLKFGVNAHPLWGSQGDVLAQAERARASGLTSLRVDVPWDRLQPTGRGAFDAAYVAKIDALLDVLAADHVQPVLTLIGTPAWARHGAGSRSTPPDSVEDYADAVAYLAGRYASRPGLAYEVWNEPNQPAFWDAPGGPSALIYARLLRTTYVRVKTVAPNAIVLGGSIAYNDPTFLDDLYTFGGVAGNFDALAIHPYSGDYPPDSTGDGYQSFLLAVQQLGQVMTAHGEPSKPIWITEIGWSAARIGDATRATYFRRAVELVRGWPRVGLFSAYDLDQAQDFDFGLINQGSPTISWLRYTVSVGAPNAGSSYPTVMLDTPAEGASVGGGVLLAGWALDSGAPSGTGVDRVTILLDGATVGSAAYGQSRPDIAAAYGQRFTNVGYSYTLDLARVAAGPHTVDVLAHSTVAGLDSPYVRALTVTTSRAAPAGSSRAR